MCPLWPFHSTILLFLSIIPVAVITQKAPRLLAEFKPDILKINMSMTQTASVNLLEFNGCKPGDFLYIKSLDDHIASTDFTYYQLQQSDLSSNKTIEFNVTGNFLGKTKIFLSSDGEDCKSPENRLDVIVTRMKRVIDVVFHVSVALLVSIIYINFGCALDWNVVKETIKRPTGPAIGFCTQFIFMPLISYLFGLLLFPNSGEMRLGMFFTGVSPGGGASNIWTFVLKGNLNLSITMTTLSTFLAFGMMPFWLFTLGQVIFEAIDIAVPYSHIAELAAALVIPLAIGLLSQKYFPRFAKLMVRILKTFSVLLLLFIIIFAIITNLYLFELFSWKIIVAGMCVPWLGYAFGYIAAYLLKQPPENCLAIALETGIQNTGISIFLLRFSLPQPEADLTTVIPVSIAIMTPLPMICLYLYQVIKAKMNRNDRRPVSNLEEPISYISPKTENNLDSKDEI